MMRKKYICLVLIMIISIIGASAVSAAEDISDDIVSANAEEIILDEPINEDISSGIDDEELILDENIDELVDSSNEDSTLSEDEPAAVHLKT